MRLRSKFLLVGLAMAAGACGSTTDKGSELPDSESWTAENPQPSEGIRLHLILDFLVDDEFDSDSVKVTLDGELIVEGTGHANPDAHCNRYGPYLLMVDSGTHKIEVVTRAAGSFIQSFILTGESTGLVLYEDRPSAYDPISDPEYFEQPELRWMLSDGRPGCA